MHDVYEIHVSVVVGFAHRIAGTGNAAIADALCPRLFDDSVPIKKAPELVGRAYE